MFPTQRNNKNKLVRVETPKNPEPPGSFPHEPNPHISLIFLQKPEFGMVPSHPGRRSLNDQFPGLSSRSPSWAWFRSLFPTRHSHHKPSTDFLLPTPPMPPKTTQKQENPRVLRKGEKGDLSLGPSAPGDILGPIQTFQHVPKWSRSSWLIKFPR